MSAKIDAAMIHNLKDLLGDRFNELVDRFVQDGERRMALLRSAMPARDFDVIHAEAHGLKGSSRNVGANTLGDVCDQLEQSGRNKKLDNLATLFAALEQEFAAVCAELRTYC
jgi:HPt (histidine-containing phosphotransfer) domain-containing protein